LNIFYDWRHESRNGLNTNVLNNVEHDNDKIVVIDNHLNGRPRDLNTAASACGSLHATRVPGGIRAKGNM
jgi:hypothetical protein